MHASRWPGILAQVIWIIHAAVYAVIAVGALYAGIAFPGVAAIPLLVAAVLFAAVYMKRNRRIVLRTLAAAGVQLVLGILLLGGRRSAFIVDGHEWRGLPGLPEPLQVPAWVVGLLLPPAITVYALRQIRRGEQRHTLSGAT